MTYPQIIQDVKAKGYYAASSSAEMKVHYNRLLQIRESDLMGNVLNEAKVVRSLLELKIAVTIFIESGLDPADMKQLIRVIEYCKVTYNFAKGALDPNYDDSNDPFAPIIEAVKKLCDYTAQITSDFDGLVSDGSYVGKMKDFYLLVDKYSNVNVEPIAELFPETKGLAFRFVSLKTGIYTLLAKKRDMVLDAMFSGFSLDGSFNLESVHQYDSLRTVTTFSLAQGIKESPVLFVCTPIREEFDIMLNANLHSNGIERILQVDLTRLPKNPIFSSADSLSRFLLYVKRQKDPNVIVFYGLETLSQREKKDLYVAITDYMNYVANDIRLVFWDISGDMQGLTEYSKLKNELSLLPAENRYLRFPEFAKVQSIAAALDPKKLETLRIEAPFMGYRGLNLLYSRHDEMGLAVDSIKSISDANKSLVMKFLEQLPDDTKLIPADWGLEQVTRRPSEPGEIDYDYDQIRDISDDRICAIIANREYTIFEKCGELVRYILLADEDKSVWMGVLDEGERERRIIRATQVIAYTMRVYYSKPVVKVVTTREGAWGGVCCNGGQEIKFKKHCSEDIDWMMDSILHELYHSLQHTLTDTDVDPMWYKKTYHISNERIASWYSNNYGYVDIDENRTIYEVQAIEVDARSFAGECLGDQVYHGHTHEKRG